MEGIRAEIAFREPRCPVAEAAEDAGSPVRSTARSVEATADTVTEEFVLGPDAEPEAGSADVERVFDYADRSVYRFERDSEWGCPCEAIESHGCPVFDIHTREGDLRLAFHASDHETLRKVVSDLRERWDVRVAGLFRSGGERGEGELVLVDRGALTERQREVLETAFRMGYFASPPGANAGEVATELGVNRSTFREHLSAAQSKLLGAVLEA
jgi:predicted DNA binding protein